MNETIENKVTSTTAPTTTNKSVFATLKSWLAPILLVAYAKGKIILLFLMKSAIFAPVFTFLASWGAYGLWLGWTAGLGLMVHLLVHEFGHYLTSKWLGIRVSLPKFVPFIGAWVSHEDPRSDYKNALIALGGPTAGLALAVICLAVWHFFDGDSHFWLWMAATGFLLNLSNLLPIHPLDGGHVVSKIAPRLVALTPYALALAAPAFGEDQVTTIAIFLLFSAGLFSNKNLQLCLAIGITVGAIVSGHLWNLVGAGFFAALALWNLDGYITRFWQKFFSLIFGKKIATSEAKEKSDDVDISTGDDAHDEHNAEPAVEPLTMSQRIGIGAWYIGLLIAGCPIGLWLFKLISAHAH